MDRRTGRSRRVCTSPTVLVAAGAVAAIAAMTAGWTGEARFQVPPGIDLPPIAAGPRVPATATLSGLPGFDSPTIADRAPVTRPATELPGASGKQPAAPPSQSVTPATGQSQTGQNQAGQADQNRTDAPAAGHSQAAGQNQAGPAPRHQIRGHGQSAQMRRTLPDQVQTGQSDHAASFTPVANAVTPSLGGGAAGRGSSSDQHAATDR